MVTNVIIPKNNLMNPMIYNKTSSSVKLSKSDFHYKNIRPILGPCLLWKQKAQKFKGIDHHATSTVIFNMQWQLEACGTLGN